VTFWMTSTQWKLGEGGNGCKLWDAMQALEARKHSSGKEAKLAPL
jgi:hypothetical protein